MLKKIISGGQTGVDRAALDAARMTPYSWGGWCPKGRLAENGQIPEEYFTPDQKNCGLIEADKSRPTQRTAWNVRDSDATLIIKSRGKVTPGTKLTMKLLREAEKPYRPCDPYKNFTIPRAVYWICKTRIPVIVPGHEDTFRSIEVLNVAGPRGTNGPKGFEDRVRQYLLDIFNLVFMYERWGIEIWNPKKRATKPKTD